MSERIDHDCYKDFKSYGSAMITTTKNDQNINEVSIKYPLSKLAAKTVRLVHFEVTNSSSRFLSLLFPKLLSREKKHKSYL